MALAVVSEMMSRAMSEVTSGVMSDWVMYCAMFEVMPIVSVAFPPVTVVMVPFFVAIPMMTALMSRCRGRQSESANEQQDC